MRPLARLAVTLAAAVPVVPVFATQSWGATAEPAPQCAEPVAVVDYQAGAMTYSMEIDLTGCDWWTSDYLELNGSLDRISGGGPERVAGSSGCHLLSAEPAEGPPPDPEPVRQCDIELVLEHPSLELAHYQGEITYPGPNGNESQRFAAWCGTVAGLSGCFPEE